MIVTLSPAKSLDFTSNASLEEYSDIFSIPKYISQSEILIQELKKYSVDDIQALMKVSENIASLNVERFHTWDKNIFSNTLVSKKYTQAKPALFAFTGDVYKGLETEKYSRKHIDLIDSQFRILSGLYGIISPLAFIQPYRLEMGTRISFVAENTTYKNLYAFWSAVLTDEMNRLLEKDSSHELLNLASVEYFKAIERKKIIGKIIDVEFLVEKKGVLKNIGIFAKRQRGRLSHWIIMNAITNASQCKKYENDGFIFNEALSTHEKYVFVQYNTHQ